MALITILTATVACSSTKTIVGSPSVVSSPVSVAGFTILQVSDAFDVDLLVGDHEALTLQVNDNLVDRVDAGVSNGTLHIGLKPGTSAQRARLRALVTVVNLSGIELSGAAHVHLQDVLGGQDLRVNLSGASGFDGTMQANAVTADLSGASEMILAGALESFTLRAGGASQVNGGHLQVADLTVDLTGASIAIVMVTDTIAATLSGASTLEYGGNPRFTRKDVSGGSSIDQL
jgi:hypothetical protein